MSSGWKAEKQCWRSFRKRWLSIFYDRQPNKTGANGNSILNFLLAFEGRNCSFGLRFNRVCVRSFYDRATFCEVLKDRPQYAMTFPSSRMGRIFYERFKKLLHRIKSFQHKPFRIPSRMIIAPLRPGTNDPKIIWNIIWNQKRKAELKSNWASSVRQQKLALRDPHTSVLFFHFFKMPKAFILFEILILSDYGIRDNTAKRNIRHRAHWAVFCIVL